jgi:hypothetical protein
MTDSIPEAEPTCPNPLLGKESQLLAEDAAGVKPALSKATPIPLDEDEKESRPENLPESSLVAPELAPASETSPATIPIDGGGATSSSTNINTDNTQSLDALVLDILVTSPEEVAKVCNLPPKLFLRNSLPFYALIAHAVGKAACMLYTFHQTVGAEEPVLLKVLDAHYYLGIIGFCAVLLGWKKFCFIINPWVILLPWLWMPLFYYAASLAAAWYYGLEAFSVLPMVLVFLPQVAIYLVMARIPDCRPYRMVLKQTSFPDL